MENLLSKEQAQKLYDIELENINDGFKLPDMAYIHGEYIQLMKELGGDLYFSNYWYGPKKDALELGDRLAHYFKKEYEKLGPAPEDEYDFRGMVMFWDNGENAMVGNISVPLNVEFWEYDSKHPNGVKIPENMKQILFDGNDNSPYMIESDKLSKEEQKELLNLILEDYHQEYFEGMHE